MSGLSYCTIVISWLKHSSKCTYPFLACSIWFFPSVQEINQFFWLFKRCLLLLSLSLFLLGRCGCHHILVIFCSPANVPVVRYELVARPVNFLSKSATMHRRMRSVRTIGRAKAKLDMITLLAPRLTQPRWLKPSSALWKPILDHSGLRASHQDKEKTVLIVRKSALLFHQKRGRIA